VAPELEKVLAAWRTLDLGEPDDRSVRALKNRHAEGATSEQLAAAVEGARHDEWLRQGRAKSPIAVVFASLASVDRFADAGREHARKAEFYESLGFQRTGAKSILRSGSEITILEMARALSKI
jgi:hypothetical protein